MPLNNMKNVPFHSFSSYQNFDTPYVIYPMERQDKLPFSTSNISTKSIFELIHIDTWGSYKEPTHDGYKFFLTIVNDFSRGIWTFLLSNKLNDFTVLKSSLVMVERQF